MSSALDWFHTDVLGQLPGRMALVGLLLAALVVYATVSAMREHLQISRLGGRAPIKRGLLPLGKVVLLRIEKRRLNSNFRY